MPKKILIIDDDIDLVEALRLTLEKEGFIVVGW
jgi:DNA-binding response OmpR family regulator